MEYRPPPAGPTQQRPPHPHIAQQRAMSGSALFALQQQQRQQQQQQQQHQRQQSQQAAWRPPHPSHLSNVRSVSQPGPAALQLSIPNNIGSEDLSQRSISLTRSATGQTFTSSPEVISIDDDYENDDFVHPPPAKRVKIERGQHAGQLERTQERVTGSDKDDRTEEKPQIKRELSVTANGSTSAVHAIIPGAPLPPLTRANARVPGTPDASGQSKRTQEADRVRLARKAGGSGLDPPPIGVRTSARQKVTDFYPWAGSHPEDVLNETVIKHGYADKAPPASGPSAAVTGGNSAAGSSSNGGPINSASNTPVTTANPETNSAILTFRSEPPQKKQVALAVLGQIFTNILDRRATLSRYPAASHHGFKPPPRVTITDSKREAWLRDLANPAVPLRKQSRNIPYGIRGKSLLEQCLAKGIPLPRAVWLAKCVGSNELRAFRRKGTTSAAGGLSAATPTAKATAGAAASSVNVSVGESKWVREWTLHVQQWLESIVQGCGQQQQQPQGENSWQRKMEYGIKLSASFYSERLLDREYFLDWIAKSFAAAPLDKLPVWIVLVQLYWQDVVSRGKRGRLLARAILETLEKLSVRKAAPVSTSMGMLEARLRNLLILLAEKHRSCMILPRVWPKFQRLFPGLLDPAPPASAIPTTTTTNTPQHASGPSARATLSETIQKRNQQLSDVLTKTASTTQCARSKLFAALDSLGTDYAISDVLAHARAQISDSWGLVHALLDYASSVYRTGSARIFLAAALIAALRQDGQETDAAILGYLRKAVTARIIQANVFRLLAELAHQGDFAVGRYFQWLMTSGVASTTNAEFATGLLFALRRETLPIYLQGTRDMLVRRLRDSPSIVQEINIDLIEMNLLVALDDVIINATESSTSTRVLIKQFSKNPSRLAISGTKLLAKFDDNKDTAASIPVFCFLREVFEECFGMRNLLELISRAAKDIENPRCLATIVDTICRNAASFAAMGQLPSLTDLSISSYRTLRTRQPLDRLLICSMRALATLLPLEQAQDSFRKFLDADLALSDQQSASAVCSPASDSLINMSAASLDSDEDVDAVFASGNVMDEQLMRRVFARIVQRIEKDGNRAGRLSSWLTQLRLLDSVQFEQILLKYIRTSCEAPDCALAFLIVARCLIASECIGIGSIVAIATDVASSSAASVALRLLAEGSPASTGLQSQEEYQFLTRKEAYCAAHQDVILRLVGSALDEARPLCNLEELATFMRAACEPSSLEGLNVADLPPTASTNYCHLLTLVLKQSCGQLLQPGDITVLIPVEEVVQLADSLSIHICAKLLALMSRMTSALSDGKASDADARNQSAVLDAVRGGSDVWSQLLRYSGPTTIRQIYQWSRDEVLAHVAGAISESQLATSTLDILNASYHESGSGNMEDTTIVVAALVERLRALTGQLAGSTGTHQRHPDIQAGLHTLLHLVILYCSNLEAKDTDVEDDSESDSPLYQGLQSLLASLCNLLISPGLRQCIESLEYIADVAGFLADHLSEAARVKAAQNIHSAVSSDTRLASILALPASDDIWLALSTTPATIAGATSGASQQQRILAKQASVSAASAARQSSMPSSAPQQQQQKHPMRGESREVPKILVPFPLRNWEILPSVGGADSETSLNLSLFGARKVR